MGAVDRVARWVPAGSHSAHEPVCVAVGGPAGGYRSSLEVSEERRVACEVRDPVTVVVGPCGPVQREWVVYVHDVVAVVVGVREVADAVAVHVVAVGVVVRQVVVLVEAAVVVVVGVGVVAYSVSVAVGGLVGVEGHVVVVVVRAVVVVVRVSVVAESVAVGVDLLSGVGRAVVAQVLCAVVVVVQVLDVAVFGSIRALAFSHHTVRDYDVIEVRPIASTCSRAVLGVCPCQSVVSFIDPCSERSLYQRIPVVQALVVRGSVTIGVAAVRISVIYPVSWDRAVVQ